MLAHRMRIILWLGTLCSLAAIGPAAWGDTDGASLERGRYIARIASCNDCHTAGYARSHGVTPESEWLKGVSIGNQGPWGTTYAINLRLYMAAMTEDQWVAQARLIETRPPMPWFNIRIMTDADLRSLYRFIRSLGEPGDPAPNYVPPGEVPKTMVVVDTPQKPH
jgi:mono/diheme cytochrome c family protein